MLGVGHQGLADPAALVGRSDCDLNQLHVSIL
jgi:hypothetical protein